MGFEFTLVDVFSGRPFRGNQLAVFPDAHGIEAATMQKLAREFNFSETTFVLPPQDPAHTCQVRIVTPHQELPFAGHPTLGTAAALARLGDRHLTTGRPFVFEEGIGPVTVAVDGQTARLHLHSPDYEATEETPPAAAIAKALVVPADAIVDSWYAGIGLRFCFVRLAGPELVDSAVLDKAAWEAGIADRWSPNLYFFAGDHRDGTPLHARFFAPAVGIDEDPATGSACASLVASIAQRSPQQDGTFHVRVDQGVAMGRPSALEGTAAKENGHLTEVVVSGQATIVGTGTMSLPPE